MNEQMQVLQTFDFGGRQIPIYGSVEEPLFKASDVALQLDVTDVSHMIENIDDDEKQRRTMFVSGQRRNVWFLTEDGLYEVTFQSRKELAKQFKKIVKRALKELRLNGEVKLAKPVKQVSASVARISTILIESAKKTLRLSDASVAGMYNNVAKELGAPVAIDYVPSNGNLVTSSFIAAQMNISANAFNKRLEAAGIIERKTRKSHKGEKHFWCLTDKGLVYGENQVNPKNPNETFPKFYEKSAGDIINLIKN